MGSKDFLNLKTKSNGEKKKCSKKSIKKLPNGERRKIKSCCCKYILLYNHVTEHKIHCVVVLFVCRCDVLLHQ